MLRLILCVYIIFFLFFSGYAQVNKSVKEPLGLYFGGDVYGESMNALGYYYFKSDSTFIFLRPGFNPNSKSKEYKNRLNDTLAGYGEGRWSLQDSLLIIKFESVQDEYILKGELRYNAYSKTPFDSLLLKVNVTNQDEFSGNIAGVSISNRFIGNPLGGNSQVTLPLNYSKYKVEIYKSGYVKQAITLQPRYNTHEITITLTPQDSSIINLVASVKIPYKFHYKNEEMIFIGNLRKQSEGKEKLASIVKNSFKKFPTQIALLNKILKELQ
jgi:hypothetical protein